MLYLVRHGRTTLNAEGMLQGRLDPPLDDVGHRQAKAMAERVGEVDHVITSPLLRATETASYFGGEPTADERWIELAYGEYEGVPMREVPDEVWRGWRTDSTYAPDGGENYASLDARVRSALVELAGRIQDERIVVVSHVSPIKAAVAWALHATTDIMFHCYLAQASLCRIDIGFFGPLLRSFNEQADTAP